MAKVTSKLQVTIPKRIADKHRIVPGDQIRFESVGDAIRITPEKVRGGDVLSVEERLRLFDQATERAKKRASCLTLPDSAPTKRDWRREELYDRGEPD